MDPTAPRLPVLRRRRFSLVGAVALVVTFLLGTAVRAEAHGEEGIMEILELTAAGSTVTLEVGVVYANDDDPAEEAAVTVTATGPDGGVVGPLPVPNVTSGRYGASFEVPAPGTWSVAVSATGPAAATTATVEAGQSSETTAPPTTAPPATVGSATDPDATVAPSTDATTVTDPAAGDDDDGGSGVGLVVLALLVAAVVAAAVVAVGRGRSQRAVD